MPHNPEFYSALFHSDFDKAEELLRLGADINAQDESGDTLLADLLLDYEENEKRYLFAKWMLGHGANPRLVDKDGGGPLFSAVIVQDTDLLRLLLDHGADPNLENDQGETLYDYAEFDYRDETHDFYLPEKPTDVDKATVESWLQFLDRIAIKYQKRRPDYLFLLRERGALTWREQQQMQSGRSAKP